jgi:hypothetical protein
LGLPTCLSHPNVRFLFPGALDRHQRCGVRSDRSSISRANPRPTSRANISPGNSAPISHVVVSHPKLYCGNWLDLCAHHRRPRPTRLESRGHRKRTRSLRHHKIEALIPQNSHDIESKPVTSTQQAPTLPTPNSSLPLCVSVFQFPPCSTLQQCYLKCLPVDLP